MATLFDETTKLPETMAAFVERSNIALTLADATNPDCVLVCANAAFLRLTGYREDEVIGKNCRFLQPFGGAGPVTKRIRRFIENDGEKETRFLIPNVKRDGTPFLNLLYLSKLRKNGRTRLILGSQFLVGRNDELDAELYDRALKEDLRQLNLLTNENNWVLLGSYDALASSHAIIAQMRLE